MRKLTHMFRRKRKQVEEPRLLNPVQQAEHTAYLNGHSSGYQQGKQLGFDLGYTEGYNEGRTAGVEETKAAALQALTKGESNGKQKRR